MAAPIKPAVAALTLPPMTDPTNVAEVFSNDVVLQYRHGSVQMTFSSIQACDSASDGTATDKRIVVSRVAMPMSVFQSLIQIGIALERHHALATSPDTGPAN